jgi:DNA-binding transcriptional LysR family regulator
VKRAIDVTLLPTFLAVLDARRISAAAKVLHLSQPAVTAQVRRLEEGLGTPLFTRSARGVAPTDAALRLAEHARAVHRQLEQAVADVALERPATGPLVVAASTTVAAHVLPPLLAAFRAKHPRVPVRVRVGNTEQVLEDLRAERVPLGIVEGHARASGLRLEPLVDDEIVPVIGCNTPLVVRELRDLDSVPLLWREAGSGTRAVVERALAKAGLGRRTARALDLELGSTEAILGGAAAGLGVGFVSRWSARAHLAAGQVRVVPGVDLVLRRTFRWALPAGAPSGQAAVFYGLARTVALDVERRVPRS